MKVFYLIGWDHLPKISVPVILDEREMNKEGRTTWLQSVICKDEKTAKEFFLNRWNANQISQTRGN